MNSDKYQQIFVSIFSVPISELTGEFTYNSIPAWDSVGHMALIAALEREFDIMMETDDIIDLSSFNKGKEILVKYGIVF